jgi:adenine-specific DNA-methyltransferase
MTERKYEGDTFHNQWQSFRVKKNPTDDYEATHKYEESREYQIMVKVVDVFENGTNKRWCGWDEGGK